MDSARYLPFSSKIRYFFSVRSTTKKERRNDDQRLNRRLREIRGYGRLIVGDHQDPRLFGWWTRNSVYPKCKQV